ASSIVRIQATAGAVTQVSEGAVNTFLLAVHAAGAVGLPAANAAEALAIDARGGIDYRDVGPVTSAAVTAFGCFTAPAVGISSGGGDVNLAVGGDLLLTDPSTPSTAPSGWSPGAPSASPTPAPWWPPWRPSAPAGTSPCSRARTRW